MKLAYLTNQYPKISHSFIRHEILGLEALGMDITRVSIRRAGENFPDPADRSELARTTFLLDGGAVSLFAQTLRVALKRPRAFARALRQTVELGWGSQRGLARHFTYLAEAAVLFHFCVARGITHLHVHHATNPAAVALLCRALGGPTYSLTIHGPEEFVHGKQLALHQKIAAASFVITVSEWGRREIAKWCDKAHHDRIFLVRSPVDESFSACPPAPVDSSAQILWVGRLEPQKNPLMFVQAVHRLRELRQLPAQNTPCAVTMLGDGSLRPALAQEISRSRLESTFILGGWADRHEILTQLRAARALVLSSRSENLPMVIQEAFMQGRPVISTNVGGIDELVHDGVNGWLVPSDSVDALAGALQAALCAAPRELERMGERGRRLVLKEFDPATHLERLRTLFESVSPQGN